jgi:hypothetical protein
LARVAAELLLIPEATNAQCGVSSSSAFAAAYLNILRSSGLTRRQEVTKLLQGGLQRVAQLTVAEYEAETQRKEAKAKAEAERKATEEAEERARLAQEAVAASSAAASASTGIKKIGIAADPDASITPEWDEDQPPAAETDEQMLTRRSDEILRGVWKELEARMYTKSTSRSEFFDTNRDMARGLAEQELAASKAALVETSTARRRASAEAGESDAQRSEGQPATRAGARDVSRLMPPWRSGRRVSRRS